MLRSGMPPSAPSTEASARLRQNRMARAVSATDNGASTGTNSASRSANNGTVRSATLATIACTCPPDRSPARQAAATTGSSRIRRAVPTSPARKLGGEAAVLPQPRHRRDGAVLRPVATGVEGTDRLAQLGLQAIDEPEHLDDGLAEPGDLEVVDRCRQLLELHACIVHMFDVRCNENHRINKIFTPCGAFRGPIERPHPATKATPTTAPASPAAHPGGRRVPSPTASCERARDRGCRRAPTGSYASPAAVGDRPRRTGAPRPAPAAGDTAPRTVEESARGRPDRAGTPPRTAWPVPPRGSPRRARGPRAPATPPPAVPCHRPPAAAEADRRTCHRPRRLAPALPATRPTAAPAPPPSPSSRHCRQRSAP